MMKTIDFPEDEIPTISKQKEIITHRVSDDFDKYQIGDIVSTSFGKKYKVIKKRTINSIEKSPFSKFLTRDQLDLLKKFDKIDVLKLSLVLE